MTTLSPVAGLTTRPATGTNWQISGLCRDEPDLFFAKAGPDAAEAKETCRVCPVRAECLTYALDNDERLGIWGGLTERERRKYRARRPAPTPKPVVARPAPRRPEHTGGNPLAPCGTETAYRRHKRHKEPIDDACQAGHEEWLDQTQDRRRETRKRSKARARERRGYAPKKLAPCGTPAAAYRHRRLGEPIDDACRLAYNAARRKYEQQRAAARRQAANAS